MLHQTTVLLTGRSPTPRPGRLYLVMLANAMIFVWMLVFGSWLDTASRLTSVASLGGHHVVVMILAGAVFVGLAVLAALTAGFTAFTPLTATLTSAACVASVVAAAGVLSFLMFAVLARLLFGSVPGLRGRR